MVRLILAIRHREVARVERDVRLGYVTRNAALDIYGVVLDDEGGALSARRWTKEPDWQN